MSQNMRNVMEKEGHAKATAVIFSAIVGFEFQYFSTRKLILF